jgi:hypothetical protein
MICYVQSNKEVVLTFGQTLLSGPAHTIAPRAKPPPIEVLPGPADYQKVEQARTGPAFTIAARYVLVLGTAYVQAPADQFRARLS